MRSAVLVALALAPACTVTHDPNAITVANRDCYACHQPDYEATPTWPASSVIPMPVDHVPSGNPPACGTGCASCHVAPTASTPPGTGWANNLGGCAHPETNFPLVSNSDPSRGPVGPSPHATIDCIGCHDPSLAGTSAQGANTNCVHCHPDDAHQQNSHGPLGASYAYVDSVANFCLGCHPAGLALKHPESIFSSTHQGSSCAHCHDAAISNSFATNPNCMASGCHVLSRVETQSEHTSMRYMIAKVSPMAPWTTNDFCLTCHAGGGNGGG